MKRNRLLTILFILAILFGLCLGVGLVTGAARYLPVWAESQFGPGAASLGQMQRVLLSARLLRQAQALKQPANPAGVDQAFRVELGEAPPTIAGHLQRAGLITDSAAFQDYLVYAGLDTTIQAGDYVLSQRMTPMEIAHALQDATPAEVTFNILPGWRLEEIALTLPTSGLEISPEEFLLAASRMQAGSALQAELPDSAGWEGFLLPGSYQIKRSISPELFIEFLTDQFSANLGEDLRSGFARQELSLYAAVTLASIVQREAVVEDEMPLIASVFLNRMRAGMKLDADPTVQYAIGFNDAQNTWWTNPLSSADLQINSPYNTYLNWGLPPGPIANPSPKALQAVAYPAQTPYYFFRAACDGSGKHIFAETFEQHVGNACK